MSGHRDGEDAPKENDVVTHHGFEEGDRGWMRDECRKVRVFPLDVAAAPLFLAVVRSGRVERGDELLEMRDLAGREQVGHDDVTLEFEVTDPIAEGEPAPIRFIEALRGC